MGFTDDGSGHLVAKVAEGSNFDLRVQAFRGDTEIPVIPQKVEVRYRDDAGGRDRKTMKNIGRPASSPGTIYPWSADAVLQEYSHQFTGVLSTQHLDIAGGDARLRTLQLKVVPNPDLTLKLVCKYPHYIERQSVDDRPGQSGGSRSRADRLPRHDLRHCHQAAGDGADRRPGQGEQPGVVAAIRRRRTGRRAQGVHVLVRTVPCPQGQTSGCRRREWREGRRGKERRTEDGPG